LTLQIVDKILHDKKYANKLAVAETATGRLPNHEPVVAPLNTDASILEGALEDKGAAV
jgi:predicted Zn-dependent protease